MVQVKFNYDPVAFAIAIPDKLIEDPLEVCGEFVITSDEEIPNFSRFRTPAVDANGKTQAAWFSRRDQGV